MRSDLKAVLAVTAVVILMASAVGIGYSGIDRNATTDVSGNRLTIESGTFMLQFGDVSGQLSSGSQISGLLDGNIDNGECTTFMEVVNKNSRGSDKRGEVPITIEWLKDAGDTSTNEDNILTVTLTERNNTQKIKVGNDRVSEAVTVSNNKEYRVDITGISGTDAALQDNKKVSLRFTAVDGKSEVSQTLIDNHLTFTKEPPINSGNSHLDSPDPEIEMQYDEDTGSATISNTSSGTLTGGSLLSGFSLSISPSSELYKPFYLRIVPGGVVVTVSFEITGLDGGTQTVTGRIGPSFLENLPIVSADYWGENSYTVNPAVADKPFGVFDGTTYGYIDINDYANIKITISTDFTGIGSDSNKTSVKLVFEPDPAP